MPPRVIDGSDAAPVIRWRQSRARLALALHVRVGFQFPAAETGQQRVGSLFTPKRDAPTFIAFDALVTHVAGFREREVYVVEVCLSLDPERHAPGGRVGHVKRHNNVSPAVALHARCFSAPDPTAGFVNQFDLQPGLTFRTTNPALESVVAFRSKHGWITLPDDRAARGFSVKRTLAVTRPTCPDCSSGQRVPSRRHLSSVLERAIGKNGLSDGRSHKCPTRRRSLGLAKIQPGSIHPVLRSAGIACCGRRPRRPPARPENPAV
jgi:hypothetical protein